MSTLLIDSARKKSAIDDQEVAGDETGRARCQEHGSADEFRAPGSTRPSARDQNVRRAASHMVRLPGSGSSRASDICLTVVLNRDAW